MNLRVKMTSVQDEFREKTGELKGFGVDPTDYVKEKPKVEYSKNKLDLAQKEMGALRDRFTEIQSDIDGLRQEIIGALGSRKSGSFDDLFEHLRNDYITTSVDLKSINSELIAQILLTKVIRTTEKKEMDRVGEILSSKDIKQPLFAITGRYKEVILEHEEFYVNDGTNDYKFSELSTGATEQIFTALRLGFASRVFGRMKGFSFLMMRFSILTGRADQN